jgi:hypothetical protein
MISEDKPIAQSLKDSLNSLNPQYMGWPVKCEHTTSPIPKECPNYSDGSFMCLCCEECRETCEEE